jgi:outer membrane protein
MKRFIKMFMTLFILVSMTREISAQTVNSGAWMIGGSLGFNSIKSEGDDASETWFNISPSLGYFVINDLAAGVRLSLFSQSYDGETESQFGIGPWARYYIASSSLFAQAGIDFGSAGFDIFSLLAEDGSTTINLGIGYSWFINNSVAIEPILQYSIFSAGEDGFIDDYNRFGFNIAVQAFLGRN